ncbi:hypothetical protein SASPL_119619 [Salvia splendens]|uniref:Uncharacterized protein n=1 Tax=Salvia splendens TaxID=180675 RepID=A0A8X8XRS2_SALSN|nr:hypothetical protein SASPL_119619 [Salvia splendens]
MPGCLLSLASFVKVLRLMPHQEPHEAVQEAELLPTVHQRLVDKPILFVQLISFFWSVSLVAYGIAEDRHMLCIRARASAGYNEERV